MKHFVAAALLLVGCATTPTALEPTAVVRPESPPKPAVVPISVSTALQEGFWELTPSPVPLWYVFQADNQCKLYYIDQELGATVNRACIWRIHEEQGNEGLLALSFDPFYHIRFEERVILEKDQLRLKGKQAHLQQLRTDPLLTRPPELLE